MGNLEEMLEQLGNERGTGMQVKALAFSRSPKPSVLASVRIELAVDGDSITIDDARVLKNRHGQLWLAMPSYSVPASGGRGYDYQPAVILSTALKRAVEDAVLPEFESWERQQASAPAQGGGR